MWQGQRYFVSRCRVADTGDTELLRTAEIFHYISLYSMFSLQSIGTATQRLKAVTGMPSCKALQSSMFFLSFGRCKQKALQNIISGLGLSDDQLSGYAGYLLGSAVLNGLAGNRTTAGV